MLLIMHAPFYSNILDIAEACFFHHFKNRALLKAAINATKANPEALSMRDSSRKMKKKLLSKLGMLDVEIVNLRNGGIVNKKPNSA